MHTKMNTVDVHARGLKWRVPSNDVLSKSFIDNTSDTHEPHLTMFIQEYINEGDIVLDIGACFGFHTLELSKLVGENGRVYAFEPQHDMCELLNFNVESNKLKNTLVYQVALGDVEMDVCMYNAFPHSQTNFGDSFISWKYDEDGYSSLKDMDESDMIGKGNELLVVNKQIVACKRLDDFNFFDDSFNVVDGGEKVKFVKMDVQGFELMVLQGGEKFIDRHRPIMVIEFENNCMQFHGYTTKELVEWLHQRDYEIMLLDYSYPCDHVCIPRENSYAFYSMFKGHIFPHTTNNPINNNVLHGVRKKLCMLE